ncbi:kinase complex, IKAP component [Lecanosticta acicola]|uniref:Elongator complex protein 1 n=1 Tax=Lecanosticta acicola TaxID=111012 RepID=A0AAI8YZP1_9PEZI|nr:kinase complex, IKAP component [Lecanosticta acicola]
MRNLRNIKHAAITLEEFDEPITATAWDGDDLVCSLGPSMSNPTICLRRLPKDAYGPDQAITIASWDAVSPNPDLPYDKVLNLHCFPDTGSTCLVLEGGDIVVAKEDGEELIEIVGSVDAGINAAAWSPDEELLLIASKANTLLFMTREFEGTASINLSTEDLKVSNHVSVGWGKRETQFQGRGAKALKDPTVPEHVDEGKLSDFDDARTTISWRGDGQFVAVNSILEGETKRRIIRVYSRDGVLDSVSEPVDGLEGALSWKPSGQLIAGIQRQDDRIEVVFFERNGLRHGEFALRLSKTEMNGMGGAIDLAWNADSSVIAVSLKDRVQLWTMSNYHYYLKQEIMLGATAHSFAVASWHPERALQLACFAHTSIRLLSYASQVACGSVVPPYDHGTVAVIDGQRLKLTPLRTANVPPPMALDEIDLPANTVDVAISKKGTKIAVLHQDSVSIWDCDYSSKPAKRPKLSSAVPLSTDSSFAVPRQLVLDENDEVLVVSSGVNMEGAQLACLPTRDSAATVDLDGVTLISDTNHKRTIYENASGAICDFSAGAQIGKLPTVCPAVKVWREGDAEIVFGLTAGGLLHVQSASQTLKISSCTSFVVTRTHLVYTTGTHLLKFVHLHSGELEVPPDEPEKDERCRNVERGAKLVTVMPSAYSLVLQMPRGNLETIYPRALVLAGIRHEIGQRHYKKAFLICRTQRVDMNILHDYAPQQFMMDVDRFIRQVKKVEYIDLFLSSLSEEDVSQTLYKETLKASVGNETNGLLEGHEPHQPPSQSSKVNQICDAFLKALSGQESTHLQNVVSAHVCKNPPDLEAGLSLVADLRKSGKQEQLEQAVEHICFLTDVNQIYDTALGIYDLDVALLAAQQSQKDPREYLPYLQNLHSMESLRQRHAIDNDLKRYKKALSHLHSAGDFEELKAYVEKHDLYSTAIELYRYDDARLSELMRMYADFLSSRNRYKEAGIAYEYVSDYASAYEAYRACSMWGECLACAGLIDMSEERTAELARDLADGLEEAKHYVEAATVYLEHLRDLESAVRLLCRGYRFADAIRQVAIRKRPELLRDLVDPGLIEASATMTEMLAEMKTQLNNQIPRLRELRRKKAEDPMAFLDGGGDYDADIPDNISLAPTDSTTAGTFMTRYTNRSMGTLATNATRKTSKNRRREERKRARGKKGTVYEEEYLVNSIARLMERVNETGEDIGRLVEGLMRRAMRERALAVEGVFQDVLVACRGCMEEVFCSSLEPQLPANTNGEGERPWGGQAVLWEAMSATQQKREAPVLRAFEKLSLLET